MSFTRWCSRRTHFSSHGRLSALAVLEEAVERDVAAAHEIRLAVEHRPARRRIELELAHAEPRAERVRAAVGFERVEERVFGRPQPAVFRAGCGRPPSSPRPWPARPARWSTVRQSCRTSPRGRRTSRRPLPPRRRCATRPARGPSCRQRRAPPARVMKCGVPERINSTESKMPGMYRSFSKSKPSGYARPTASRSAPTRISDFVAAGLERRLGVEISGRETGRDDRRARFRSGRPACRTSPWRLSISPRREAAHRA